MTKTLFRDDAYLQDCTGVVLAHTEEGGLILDQTVFYPTGGGQPHDTGSLTWEGGGAQVTSVTKQGDVVWHRLDVDAPPGEGTAVEGQLDWAHPAIGAGERLL